MSLDWLSSREAVPPPRDGWHAPAWRRERETRELVVLGADPEPWGPYGDEATAVQQSYELVKYVRPAHTPAAWLIYLGMGWGESRFGVTPDFQRVIKPGPGLPEGDRVPSWNWGAVVASKSMVDEGMVVRHGDHTADGKPVTWDFAAFDDAEAGFRYWVERLPSASLPPAQDGNARGFAEALYQKCWYSNTCPPACSDAARIEGMAKVLLGYVAHVLKFLPAGTKNDVHLGELQGLKMGGCAWHDAAKGGGGGGGGTGTSKGGSDASDWILPLAAVGGLGLLLAKGL